MPPKKYRVEIGPKAEVDAEKAFRWLLERYPAYAAEWHEGLLLAVDSLEQLPERCPAAPEGAVFGKVLRQLLYGERPHIYRVIYLVQGDLVHIIRIRYAAMRILTLDELLEAV